MHATQFLVNCVAAKSRSVSPALAGADACRRQAGVLAFASAPWRRQAGALAFASAPCRRQAAAPSLYSPSAPPLRLLLHLHFYTWPWPLFDCFGPGPCPVFNQAVRLFLRCSKRGGKALQRQVQRGKRRQAQQHARRGKRGGKRSGRRGS